MKALDVTFFGLRYNSSGYPIALIDINGQYGAYELDALEHLIHIKQGRGFDATPLITIHANVIAERNSTLADLSSDDFSGQTSLL